MVTTLAEAGTIEVALPADLGREVVEFPWEFVLAEATHARRHKSGEADRTLVVTRHVPTPENGLQSLEERFQTPPKVMVVEGPGEFRTKSFTFESERQLMFLSLGVAQDQARKANEVNPDLVSLKTAVTTFQPDILHITGVDNLQGAALLGVSPPVTDGDLVAGMQLPEGMYFSDQSDQSPQTFESVIAAIMVAKVRPPGIVVFNCYNSSRGAWLAATAGATISVGFQDEIDDSIAEQFLGAFYRELVRAEWDVLRAFKATWTSLGNPDRRLRGTGIVLWSSKSLVPARLVPSRAAAVRAQRQTGAPTPAPEPPPKRVDPGTVTDPTERLSVEFTPPSRLNYSMLHNNRAPFDLFRIKIIEAGTYDVCVEFVLNVGNESAAFHGTYTLDHSKSPFDLINRVRVPLTSTLARSIMESIFTSIYVKVMWGEHVLHHSTDRVELLPCDEWVDDDLNRRWLPSFVAPRDPMVRKLVDEAQPYLKVIVDDDAAGFDGYQSVDDQASSMSGRYARVDAQVQALWWTFVQDHELAYINPPPTFSERSQRLRTPTDIVTGNRGTCIDLALLLAACLEYIQIEPVVFLLVGHAFPGYVRGIEGRRALDALYLSPGTQSLTGTAPVAVENWIVPAEQWRGVNDLIRNGLIVPVETTMVATRSGFWDAVEQGARNLRNEAEFESIFDIQRSRRSVTPLPIWSRT